MMFIEEIEIKKGKQERRKEERKNKKNKINEKRVTINREKDK